MKALLFANTEWYLYNFRLPLAKHLKDQGFEVLLLSPPGEYGKRFAEHGLRWQAVPMERRSLHPWRELKLLWYLVRLYAREKPDVAHHFTIKCVVYGSIAARLAGVKNRINAVTGLGHVFTTPSLKNWLLRPVVRGLLRFALGGKNSRLIVQNPDDFDMFTRHGLAKPDKVRLIRGSGVDTNKFQPVTPPLLPEGERRPVTVLLAGRLLREKGIYEYREAARLVKQAYPETSFLLAGEPDSGNPSSLTPQELLDWKQEGTVTLLGHVEDMQALLAHIDIMVLPSYREGTPRSLLEAAACGLPLVATDVPGCREIVKHERNGFLVPSQDAVALANALKALLHDSAVRHKMGVESRQIVLAEFDQQRVLRKTFAVYQELLSIFS
jgi:glycosyltransferase involved in cell wall biosynthesis